MCFFHIGHRINLKDFVHFSQNTRFLQGETGIFTYCAQAPLDYLGDIAFRSYPDDLVIYGSFKSCAGANWIGFIAADSEIFEITTTPQPLSSPKTESKSGFPHKKAGRIICALLSSVK